MKQSVCDTEIWKPVVGYEDLYEVSNTGRVRSLNYRQTGKVRELRPGADRCGYLLVALCKNGKQKSHHVHKLVIEAFVGPRPEGYDVNHIDEDKRNNSVKNLEYCTHRDNINHGTRNQRDALSKSMPILEFDQFATLAFRRCWPSTAEAGRAGYNQGNVWRCCKGRLKYHHGKTFRYLPVSKDTDFSNWSIADCATI